MRRFDTLFLVNLVERIKEVMRVHFIAIGGSAMHNLAIALKRKGDVVTGSDDEIFEPSKSRLAENGILPKSIGWNTDLITTDLDAIILGMHARIDNPELLKAQKLDLKIYSYPEFIFEQTKDKIRLVVGGSHGKTSITSMLLHVMDKLGIETDFLVGALLDGFDCMVQLSDAKYIVIEGDEYLSSPIDLKPKFHWYAPHIALISGIAWDHINVFPTFENYVSQFKIFTEKIEEKGSLIYFKHDESIQSIVPKLREDIQKVGYEAAPYKVVEGVTYVHYNNQEIPLKVFGNHNLQNIEGARLMLKGIGVSDDDFYRAIQSFKGAAKRLELIAEGPSSNAYKDFAHSPSKLKATVSAVNEQFPNRKLIACMELHTFSSLKKEFLPQYDQCMVEADEALVYFSPEVVAHKKLDPITAEMVEQAFGSANVKVYTNSEKLQSDLKSKNWENSNLLLMSSGNFHGIDLNAFAKSLIEE
ncbi:UDP-N-acetylmuramate--L-alanine ligase [Crocinitomix algicola]|uniref:UDP-N-acetylmuramate--L-alanine ligase n=1 Tax=Crocinitomix algicola TaxID=1740263 RepID=UPI000A7D218F